MVHITTPSPKNFITARGPMAGKGETVMKNVVKTTINKIAKEARNLDLTYNDQVEPVKEEPKFKVGELVRIRQWDDMEKEFGLTMLGSISCQCCFTDEMKPLCGKYAEIEDLNDGQVELKFFNCDDLDTCCAYSTDMIEKV